MNDRTWRIAKLHSVIFIAIKRPVAIGRNWPGVARHIASKSMTAIGKTLGQHPTLCGG